MLNYFDGLMATMKEIIPPRRWFSGEIGHICCFIKCNLYSKNTKVAWVKRWGKVCWYNILFEFQNLFPATLNHLELCRIKWEESTKNDHRQELEYAFLGKMCKGPLKVQFFFFDHGTETNEGR